MSTMFNSCGAKSAAKNKKTTQTTTQSGSTTSANTYGYMPGADSGDIQALRDFQFAADPRIPYSFARERQNFNNTFQNPLGGFYSATQADAMKRAHGEDSAQQEAQALREENQGLQGLQYGKLSDIASRTAPRLVQTGGTSSSTGNSSGVIVQPGASLLDPFASGGMNMGAALLA